MHAHDLIVAQSSPQGSGAISLIRLTGDNFFHLFDDVVRLRCGDKLSQVPSHTCYYAEIFDGDQMLDQTMIMVLAGPRTFTGQDTLEIMCHGNPMIVHMIIQLMQKHGARLADRGEFTRRALENGKIDILQTEAIADLLVANSQQAVAASLQQVKGSLSAHLFELEQAIMRLLMFCEASFEFGAEEHDDLAYDTLVRAEFAVLEEKIGKLIADTRKQQLMRQGYKIACIGSVNAGKSTLFNALAGKERAIVSDIAGTTRDTIDINLYHDGQQWLLVDTAGLRQTGDVIESIGIQRSWQEAQQADAILLIVDASRSLSDQEKAFYLQLITQYAQKMVVVFNKADLPCAADVQTFFAAHFSGKILKVSAKHHQGTELIWQELKTLVQTLHEMTTTPFMLNQRHIGLITELAAELAVAEKFCKQTLQYELLSHHLRAMLAQLSQMTGKNISERLLDEVFVNFCVGK